MTIAARVVDWIGELLFDVFPLICFAVLAGALWVVGTALVAESDCKSRCSVAGYGSAKIVRDSCTCSAPVSEPSVVLPAEGR